jgi:small subunit ribosomal protein S6e
MGNEFPGEVLGQQFAGYIFKITGGNDKDGFCMRQGLLKNGRLRLLMAKGHKCYRPRREGERKRKSVRGCIVGKDLSVLALTIVKHGEQPIKDITDKKRARSLGPKRASKIRKLYQLEKGDDVRKYVVRKEMKNKKFKAPKIQRLVTCRRRLRKKAIRVPCPPHSLENQAGTLGNHQEVHRRLQESRRRLPR